MRRAVFPAAIAALYLGSRFFFIPRTSGILHQFLSWYFHDILAGAVMLFILNFLLTATRHPPVLRILPASAFILGCGCFWEFVTPLYLSRSVTDPWDLAAYWIGAMGYLGAVRLRQYQRNKAAKR